MRSIDLPVNYNFFCAERALYKKIVDTKYATDGMILLKVLLDNR